MKLSASIELVWQLAGREAIAAQFKEIEPEHFLMALLKVSELPVEEADRIAPGAEVAKRLATEVDALRQELADRSIDSTSVRRKLRARLGKGKTPLDGGQMHRSPACRAVFDAAVKLADDAGSETVMIPHVLQSLLASPTPAIAEVLGAAMQPAKPKRSKTPLLDEHGRDLTELAAAGKLAMVDGRQAVGRAVLEILGQKGYRSVVLVSDESKTVQSIVDGVAQTVADQNTPPVPALKGKRIVDVTGIKLAGKEALQNLIMLEKLLNEAATAKDVVLFIPALEAAATGKPGENNWSALLKRVLGKGTLQCIVAVGAATFESCVRKDPVWKRVGIPVWIHEQTDGDIPDQL